MTITEATRQPATHWGNRMTITQHTRRRVLDAIGDKGSTLREIAASSGVHISNVRMIAKLLTADGVIFTMRAGTGADSKHEVWCFTSEAARELFEEAWLDEVARRHKARMDAKAARLKAEREASGRSTVAIAAERREARKRAERDRQEAQRLADADALKKAQAKLKKQTASAGATVFKAGTLSPKPKKSAWADLPACNLEDIVPQEVECKLTTPFEVKPEDVPPLFSSLRPGQYIAPAPAWVEAVAA